MIMEGVGVFVYIWACLVFGFLGGVGMAFCPTERGISRTFCSFCIYEYLLARLLFALYLVL